MTKLYTLLFAVGFSALTAQAQTPITQWNFNDSTLTPSAGTGTLTVIGGATEGYATGNDIATGTTDKALNTTAYPADGTASGTAGIAVAVSTNGYENIVVSYDRKGSNTSSRWEQFEYTVDGSNWVSLGNNNGSTTNVATGVLWPTTTYTLPAEANDNVHFAVRMVSIFAPSTSAYQAIGDTSTYGTSGTWRFDNVTVAGTLIAEAGLNTNSIAGLAVYPNPLTGTVLNITSGSSAAKTIAVYDMLGKQVLNATTTGGAVNAANLGTGIYVVKITEEGKTATKKLVVNQ